MPWQQIGECGNGQMPEDHDWIIFCLELGIAYLKQTCSPLPKGCSLGVMWDENEFGGYPTIGLHWEKTVALDVPWDCIDRCESVLRGFEQAVEWQTIYLLTKEADLSGSSDAEEFETIDEDNFEELLDKTVISGDQWKQGEETEGQSELHKPRKDHYFFVHRFLRDRVNELPKVTFETLSRESAKDYLSVHWWQIGVSLGLTPEETVSADGIECFPMKISEDCHAIAVQLPCPQRQGEAYFVAIVYWRSSNKTRYFTLEKAEIGQRTEETFLCEWLDGNHINYGQGPNPDKKHFLWAVIKLLNL